MNLSSLNSKKIIGNWCSNPWILSFSMILAWGPLLIDAAEGQPHSQSITAPGEFLKQVQAESESIFGPNGCARIDDQGQISVVSQTTAVEINYPDGESRVADCAERIKAHIPRAKEAIAIQSEFEKNNQATVTNQQCAQCNATPLAVSDDAIPPGGMCSKNEKLKIKKLRESNPQCSMNCELTGSLKKSRSILVFTLVSSNRYCNVEQAGTSTFGCLKDFVVSLFQSLGTMAKAAWEGVKSAGKWVAGFFSTHKELEKNATQTNSAFANMSNEDIKNAQKDPVKANQSLLSKVGDALNWIMKEMVGFDTPTYSEMWDCAQCGQRISVICKLTGVVGKDIIKNAILVWIGGKAISGVLKAGKAALGGLRATQGLAARNLTRTTTGKVLVSWGTKRSAALSQKSAAAFEKFLSTRSGKATAIVAKIGVKGTVKALKVATSGAKVLDDGMLYLPRLFVRGGKNIANEMKAMASRAKVFSSTPRHAAEDAAQTGLKKISEVKPDAPLEIEVPNPLTQEMSQAKTQLGSKHTADIENAVEQSFEVSGTRAIHVGNGTDAVFLKVENPDAVQKVLTYQDGKNALVRMNDGSTLILSEGKITARIPAKDAKRIETLTGGQQRQADELALQKVKENARERGIQMTEPHSTVQSPPNELKLKSGPACGNQDILIQAGKAI